MKRTVALVAGIAAGIAVAAVVKAVFSAGKEGSAGFLGPGVLIADINLLLQLLLLFGLTVGYYLARSGNIEAHRVNQTVWVLVNTALVIMVMLPSMQDAKLTSVADLGDLRIGVTWLHAAIGTFTSLAGLWLILQMNDVLPARVHIRAWKTLMRLTLAGYWAVALLGLGTYYYWYAG